MSRRRFLILAMPRSGSNGLKTMLNCHPNITVLGELLNDEEDVCQEPSETILEQLKSSFETEEEKSGQKYALVAFKVFPEQVLKRGLQLDKLVHHLNIRHVVVLWRRDILDALTSRMIAEQTGIWYVSSEEGESAKNTSFHLNPERLAELCAGLEYEWTAMFKHWPMGIPPVFVTYEELFVMPGPTLASILEPMGLKPCGREVTYSGKQNPGPVSHKVSNWCSFRKAFKSFTFDLEARFGQVLEATFHLRSDTYHLLPDREPCPPFDTNWILRVGCPVLPPVAKQNVQDALDSGFVSSASPWVSKMAEVLKDIFQVPVAQPTCNGFSALVLALQAADIGPGDEVIVPAFTMIAVPNAVSFVGATPVLADNCPVNGYNPGWPEIEAASTPKVKAVMLTYIYGVPVDDVEGIYANCVARGWVLIEDISEVIGIVYEDNKLLGSVGHFAACSLYANKIVHAADGGFVLAKDRSVEKRLASLTNYGFTPSFHFVHFEKAINGKINGLGAALACGTLENLDQVLATRQKLARCYRDKLAGLPVSPMPNCGIRDTPWVFGIVCQSKQTRTLIRSRLAESGIETRDYFLPIHIQPAYGSLFRHLRLPVAEKIGSQGLYLPLHTSMTVQDVEVICDIIKDFFKEDSEDPLKTFALDRTNDKSKWSFRAAKEGLPLIEVRSFDHLGNHVIAKNNYWLSIDAPRLIHNFDQYIRDPSRGQAELLSQACQALLPHVDSHSKLGILVQDMHAYLSLQTHELILDSKRPWLGINLDRFTKCAKVPTTTDRETLQMLVWFAQEYGVQTCLEVGSWFGHTALLIAEAGQAKINKVVAVDNFQWARWMKRYHPLDLSDLFSIFQDNIGGFVNTIKPVKWEIKAGDATPSDLQDQLFDMVFLDISQQSDEIEVAWNAIKHCCAPGKTIVVINGLSRNSIRFFAKHSHELELLAVPNTIARAFKYVISNVIQDDDDVIQDDFKTLPRTLRFASNPGWDHHHRNAFAQAICSLKDKLHDDNAKVLFIPAVEQFICDTEDKTIGQPWIGIIHNTVDNKEVFYVPDLQMLCSPRYSHWFNNCKGLFTLTKVQEDYLKENLKLASSIPIQTVNYPIANFKPRQEESSGVVLVERIRLNKPSSIGMVLIGSYQRDFDYFYKVKVPDCFTKTLLVGDDKILEESKRAPGNIQLLERANEQEYEDLLHNSVVFLALKQDGAANTLVVEALARNVPILVPRMRSVVQYIGQDYPLLYDPGSPDLQHLLSSVRVGQAIQYLESYDKCHLSQQSFCQSICQSTLLRSLPCHVTSQGYDVTVSICSFKRTHHLPDILERFWSKQSFPGTIQIILWNNNMDRREIVDAICTKYVKCPTQTRSLAVIHSSQNYYCGIRLSLGQLMESSRLLICDDDVYPGPDFVQFFMNAHHRHPRDVLCVRGHYFLPHDLPCQDPGAVWRDYEHVRFAHDHKDEQMIHFAHMDACLLPKEAVVEAASKTMPDPDFVLVDDYWISYVLNHIFHRNIRKLATPKEGSDHVLTRTADSDQPGLALHTQTKVRDARLRLYIHHMLQGWPQFPKEVHRHIGMETKLAKETAWQQTHVGYNICSEVTTEDLQTLVSLGVKRVRIGTVGSQAYEKFDLHYLAYQNSDSRRRLEETVDKLGTFGIQVVLTLHRQLADPLAWKFIAQTCANKPNVIGYDLINEPFTSADEAEHWTFVPSAGIKEEILSQYSAMIKAIRSVDEFTPIIIEPTFWGMAHSLEVLSTEGKAFLDEFKPIVSVHFYEPLLLIRRRANQGRYAFPGKVPIYNNRYSETILWNDAKIKRRIDYIYKWSQINQVKVIVGEVGISRDIDGAEAYFKAFFDACQANKMSCFVYAFRDPDWEAMDYEFGNVATNYSNRCQNGPVMNVIKDAINKC